MNRIYWLFLVIATGLLTAACGQLLTIDDDCRISAIRVEARRDASGNQLNVYDYRFVEGACANTHVSGSYNLGTQEAQEKLERPGTTVVGVWRCPSDPWSNSDRNCTRVDLKMNGSVMPSQAQITEFETAKAPLSSYPLVQIDRDTLRGQLGNALRRLPPPPPLDIITLPPPVLNPPVAVQPPATGPLVRQGAAGLNVEAIQLLLRHHGQDIPADGEFGPVTNEAVRDFQAARGLGVDGIVGPRTWGALWVTVRQGGSEDDAIRAAQTLLRWHGHDIVVDGDFGDQTDDAVRSFQTAKGLVVDGIVGPRTWTALVNTPN